MDQDYLHNKIWFDNTQEIVMVFQNCTSSPQQPWSKAKASITFLLFGPYQPTYLTTKPSSWLVSGNHRGQLTQNHKEDLLRYHDVLAIFFLCHLSHPEISFFPKSPAARTSSTLPP